MTTTQAQFNLFSKWCKYWANRFKLAWRIDCFLTPLPDKKQSEILTSTSLSKEAKLLELAVVSRREVADVTKKPRKENSSWFKRKKQTPDY